MRHHEHPEVGSWYKDQEYDRIFEVVAMDESTRCIEIQYFSGEIEEIDLETWYSLELSVIPAPEDYSGAFEITREDLSYSDDGDAVHLDYWSDPLSDIEPDETS